MTRHTKKNRLLCRQEQESDVFLSHPSGTQRGLPDVALPNARCAPTNPFTHILYLPPLRRRKGPTKGQETHTQTYVRSPLNARVRPDVLVYVFFSLTTYTTSKYWFPRHRTSSYLPHRTLALRQNTDGWVRRNRAQLLQVSAPSHPQGGKYEKALQFVFVYVCIVERKRCNRKPPPPPRAPCDTFIYFAHMFTSEFQII